MQNKDTERYGREVLEKIVREVVSRYAGETLDSEESWLPKEEALFRSQRAVALKREMIAVGKKLWQREYVDGNGGNISCRLTDDLVLCTPTMCSKADLTAEDICLVDLDNQRVCGNSLQTSEIRLHLAIYQTVPRARAVVHCHPPHATAFAITGLCPPVEVLPECEIFLGPVPMTPFETPGTQAFADTVVPYVEKHNALLLANHGVVCWADTMTHAEWLVEVLDTYCRTVILAGQLGRSLTHFPEGKIRDILRVKQQIGLPDPRYSDGQERERGAMDYGAPLAGNRDAMKRGEFEELVGSITRQVTAELEVLRRDRQELHVVERR